MNLKSRLSALLAMVTAMSLPSSLRAEWYPPTYYPPADRAAAVRGLGFMKSKQAVPLLIELCDAADGGLRLEAVGALGSIGDPRARATLQRIAGDSQQQAVPGSVSPHHAIFVLGPTPKSMKHNVQRAAQIALTTLPADGAPREAKEAIVILKKLDRTAVARLGRNRKNVEYLRSGERNKDNAAYVEALSAIDVVDRAPGPAGAAALVGVLGCQYENLELAAARALIRRPAAEVSPHIQDLLRSADLSNLTLSAVLMVALEHQPDTARGIAKRLVHRLKGAQDFDRFPHREQALLLRALKPADVELLEELRDARSAASDRAGVEQLVRQVTGKELPFPIVEADEIPEAHRTAAIEALRGILRRGANDYDTLRAAYVLGQIKADEAVSELLDLLVREGTNNFAVYRGKASNPQAMAGWALSRIGATESIARLRTIALDKSRTLRSRVPALLAYGQIAGREAIQDLKKALAEPHQQKGPLIYQDPLVMTAWPEPFPLARTSADSNVATYPIYASIRDAAAVALSRIGGSAAHAALVGHLRSGASISLSFAVATHRLDPMTIQDWSSVHLTKGDGSTRLTALHVRLLLVPESSGRLILPLMEDGASASSGNVLMLLQRIDVNDAAVTRRLIKTLRESPQAETCNQRIGLIDAIGRQADELGEAALVRYARNGHQ